MPTSANKIFTETEHKMILGCILPIFHCDIKPSSEQCIYMFGIEWLEQFHFAIRTFFEKEAIYDSNYKITMSSLKKFGQLSASVNNALDWIEKELPCGTCVDCQKSESFRKNIIKTDYHQLFLYYESISKTLGSNARIKK